MQTRSRFSSLLQSGIARGLRGLTTQRRWVLSLLVLTGLCTVVQLLVMGLVTVRSGESVLRSQTDLRLEVLSDASDQEVRDFLSETAQHPAVADVQYETREQQYEAARTTDPKLITFLERFSLQNPFTDAISIRLRSLGQTQSFSRFLEANRWRTVVDPTVLSTMNDTEMHIFEALQLLQAIRSVLLVLLIVSVGVVFLVLTEIRSCHLATDKDETTVALSSGAPTLAVILPGTVRATVELWIGLICGGVLLALIFFVATVVYPVLLQSTALHSLLWQTGRYLTGLLPLIICCEILLAPILALVAMGTSHRLAHAA